MSCYVIVEIRFIKHSAQYLSRVDTDTFIRAVVHCAFLLAIYNGCLTNAAEEESYDRVHSPKPQTKYNSPASPPHPLTRGSTPGPSWGHSPRPARHLPAPYLLFPQWASG